MKAKRIFDNIFGLFFKYLSYLSAYYLSFYLAGARSFMGQREGVSFLTFISFLTAKFVVSVSRAMDDVSSLCI